MPKQHWHYRAVSLGLLPQHSLPYPQLLSPCTILAHHPDALFLNFWNSISAMFLSPNVWAGSGLIRAKMVGALGTGHLSIYDGKEVIVLGCGGNIPFLWGCVEEVVLTLSPSVGSIHPLCLCDPTLQVSKAGKRKGLINSCVSHRNLKYWEKLKETFM